MAKHIPMRMCLGCRQMKEKTQLIRIAVDRQTNELVIDNPQKVIARGVYLCRNADCINTARKRKALERSFGSSAGAAVYDALLEIAGDDNG